MFQTITSASGGGLFVVPVDVSYHFTFHEMPYYLVLGILCGGLAVLFTRVLGGMETAATRLARRVPRWWHPALARGCRVCAACF